MIKILTNQYKLVFPLCAVFPLFVVEGKAFAAEVEDMALRAFIEPENAFSAEDVCG